LAKLNAEESIKNTCSIGEHDNNNSSAAGDEKSAMENSDNILKETEKTLEQSQSFLIASEKHLSNHIHSNIVFSTAAECGMLPPPVRIKIPCIRKLIANWKQNRKSIKKGRQRLNVEQQVGVNMCIYAFMIVKTNLQKQIPEDEYGKDKYPEGQRLNAIIAKTGGPNKRIKNWGNNKRYKVNWQRGNRNGVRHFEDGHLKTDGNIDNGEEIKANLKLHTYFS
jgi:hypothetical protein